MMKSLRIAAVIGLIVFAVACSGLRRTEPSANSAAIDSGKFYAVLLNNNSVYFGHLSGLGTAFPVLTDVYYVQSTQNPDTKQVASSLVKRGKEWHAPDRMILNEKSIVFIEPVGTDSRVAQLIAESKK
jgi:hypothetical protein